MATYTKLSSGSWRVHVRRKGRYVSETFLRRDDARRWATETERQVDRGETPTKSRIARLKPFGELIDLHIDDMCDVGKSPRRSKAAALDMLQRHLGKCNIATLDSEWLIRFGRDRTAQGAGPVTLGIDVGKLGLVDKASGGPGWVDGSVGMSGFLRLAAVSFGRAQDGPVQPDHLQSFLLNGCRD